MPPTIVVNNLRKTYVSTKKDPGVAGAVRALFTRQVVEVRAVNGIELQINAGELVGFLGPNGAGKTTTLKMLAGILFPTSGAAKVLGFTPWERKNGFLKQISLVMGQKNQLWWDLPAIDSFLLLREIYEVAKPDFQKRLDELSELLEIGPLLNTQVRKLSLGERMKCELVAALLHAPKVVFLDEPTIGLDVVSQKRIREFLKEYQRRSGSTIILTSHYMQDIQELCERVIIIDHGDKIYDDTLALLVNRYSDVKRLSLVFTSSIDRTDLEGFGKVIKFDGGSAVIEVPRQNVAHDASAILAKLPVADISIDQVEADEIIREIFTGQSTAATLG
jgi:ABC-2 type transport system ATP-binding protein